MKTRLSALFLAFFLVASGTVTAQDFASLRDQTEQLVSSKYPDLKLLHKRQERENLVIYSWESTSSSDNVAVIIFYGASEKEAVDKMKTSLKLVSVGPGDSVPNIGDVAFLNRSDASGRIAIYFRKSNVFIRMVASAARAEELAKSLANRIEGK